MSTKSLIIVESPSKAKTIGKYVGSKYVVFACQGHVKDLPKSTLAVDIENNFEPKFIIIPEKRKILKKLKELTKESKSIILATDPDREGEAIAFHLSTELDKGNKRTKRALFNEITSTGIAEGMASLGAVNLNLVEAQKARRVIDRLVGYKVSSFLNTVLYYGLSAGRVQSVALRLICERHEEIKNFIAEEYWSIDAIFETIRNEKFAATLHHVNGKTPELTKKDDIDQFIKKIENASFLVQSIQEKQIKKSPYPPFITSTLQQEASSRLRYTPKRTMQLAQTLYEGIDIGEEDPVGLITYMRTDSFRISQESIVSTRKFIQSEFGSAYLPDKPNFYASKKKLVQDAHEAIRPTRVELTPQKLEGKIPNDLWKLYNLIWQRFLASAMTPSKLKQVTIDIKGDDNIIFRATGSVQIFDGFRKVYPPKKELEETSFPELHQGESVKRESFRPEQHFTKPPPNYTESSLINELDSRDIGRPSTFAQIVSTLYEREYILKERDAIIPTELGITVNSVLVNHLPDIINVDFTSQMEDSLDDVEAGKSNYLEVMNHFYKPFKNSLTAVENKKKEIKDSLTEKTGENCPECNSPLIIKRSRGGEKFIGCSGYPNCRHTKSLPSEDGNSFILDSACPDCGGNLRIRRSRRGRFIGCSNYPTCRYTSSIKLPFRCPTEGCDGDVVEKYTSRGKVFYGCSKYPSCMFATWAKPISETCPECQNPYLVEKQTRGGLEIRCPKCKHIVTSTEDENV